LNIRAQYGNEASRTVARDVADILNQTFNKAHIKARLSDHIFAVIYADPDVKKINKIASKLNIQLNNQHCHFENKTIELQSAIAIVPVTDIATSAQHLYDCAEETLEKCQKIIIKEDRVVIYNPLLDPSKNDSLQSIEQTQIAIENNRLRLLFQPIIPLVFNCEEHYYETFIRMIGDEGQDILPAHFLSSVKHADLSESMDKWVIENSIKQFKSSEDNQLKFKLFISVTDTVWERESLLMWLSDILRTSRVQADSIVIQISEMEAANSLSKAKYFIDGLRKLNCLICLKHYGSTGESKTILKALNPDYIKFDGTLIQQLTDDTFIDNMFEDLLTNHGKITIATQVESPKVMSVLWKYGIGMVQGFYLQAPAKEMKYEF
jgi:EAL domain-containing protein (putative c-di-GMP-specific phosphodiesterase class I)